MSNPETSTTMTGRSRKIQIALTIYISFVFIQSLFFKFSNSPETQHIFSTLDAWAADSFGASGLFLPPGPFNAYVIGSAELVASLMLLIGLAVRFLWVNTLGALLALGIISGAIVFHLFTPLGVDVQGDGGLLFGMAVGVWFAALTLIAMGSKARKAGLGSAGPATAA
ncbi:MAG: DoxX family membrane protein [Pseudomonadota bacterium]